MKIQEVIRTINQMQADGVIERYAIALQIGRAKDKARLLQFIESGGLDVVKFEEIVTRHRLTDSLLRFRRQFLDDTP